MAPRLQPPPVVNWQDYEGPFPRLMQAFGRKLELKSVNGHTAARVVTGVAQDAGYDVLPEFWPEITRKFKLPFRDKTQPDLSASDGAPSTL